MYYVIVNVLCFYVIRAPMLSKRVQLFIGTVTGRFWSWRSREDCQGHLVRLGWVPDISQVNQNLLAFIWKEWSKMKERWFSKGNPLISGKPRLVKYYNLARSRISDLIPCVESTIGDLSIRMIQILAASCEQLEQRCVFRKIPPHSVKLKERNQSNNGAETHMGQKALLEVMEPTKEEWLNPVGRVSGSSTELEYWLNCFWLIGTTCRNNGINFHPASVLDTFCSGFTWKLQLVETWTLSILTLFLVLRYRYFIQQAARC